MNKRRLLILICILLAVTLLVTMVACKNTTDDEIPEDPIETPDKVKLSTTQALDKVYNGLIAGGNAMDEMPAYGVENVFGINMRYINYEFTYKANYRANAADSEIYLGLFDVNANIYRFEAYYNAKDLYYRATEKTHVISNFSSTMMFGTFYDACRKIDMSKNFFGDEIGQIFNTNSGSVNLGILLGEQAITYNKAGEGREYVEFSNLDLTILNSSITLFMNRTFGDIGNKFDLITQKYLNFKLSNVVSSRTEQIHAKSLGFGISANTATDTHWQLTGRMTDAEKSSFSVKADLSYVEGKQNISESSKFSKLTSEEATLGKNRFTGSMLVPMASDLPFDAELITNINSKDNKVNEAKLTITDATGVNFLAGYYKDGQAFLDATGFTDWIDGAIDLAALKFPKIYEENVDVTKLISAGYINLTKIIEMFIDNGLGATIDKNLYNKVVENLTDDGVNTIYYTVTEELIQAITGDDTPLMTTVAKFLNVDETTLSAFIGEDFFSSAKLIIGYNLDTGELTLSLYKGDTAIFLASFFREEYNGVTFPSDVYAGSLAYSKLAMPDTITMEIRADLNLGNEKQSTDISRALGVMIGDTTGKNTAGILTKTETLSIRGEVSERFVTGEDGRIATVNTVAIKLYKTVNSVETLILSIRSNPDNDNQLFIDYYLPLGKYGKVGAEPVSYRINKQVIKDGFDEILGEDNVFSESNIFTILTTVLSADGISSITKQEGWFGFSLVVSSQNDPVYEILGIEDTTATVKARIFFSPIEQEEIERRYLEPVVITPDSRGVVSIYSDGSAWVDEIDVYFGETRIVFEPTYVEDSVKVITDKAVYTPQAFLFGKEITYTVTILTNNGTYKIESLADNKIIIDPAFTDKLPTSIAVVYDNGERGELACTVEDFFEGNITIAGYNLAGFDGDFERCAKSRVVIGKNSIMNVEFEVYVLVHDRSVIPAKDANGNDLYDKGVPIIATVEIDPYTYAMRSGYNPLVEGLKDVDLLFNGVYGSEEVEEDGETVTKILSYDIVGYNRFPLNELNLDWDYDFEKISYHGNLSYARAYYGSVAVAVKVSVAAQEVDYVRIDDVSDPQNPILGTNGRYTIDPLIKETYVIPSTTEGAYRVVLVFKNGDDDLLSVKKERILSVVKPMGISDDEYYENYLSVRLNWAGASRLADDTVNKTIIKLDRATTDLFGNGNDTTASFGAELGMDEQIINLTVDAPSRYQSPSSDGGKQVHAAASCTIIGGEPDYGDTKTEWISDAYFPASDGKVYKAFEPYEINPYDTAARLPQKIYLNVYRTSATNRDKQYKLYDVRWVTTDSDGNELNLIELKEDGRYGLKNPVTYEQDMFVYGKVGNRGDEKGDYVWIIATVRNLQSLATDVIYEGLSAGQTVIEIDPYKEYRLPTGFTAILESGNKITETDIIWYIHDKSTADIDDNWYPQININGIQSRYYDKNGNYVFDRKGGYYEIRYIIEGSSEVIRQTISLDVVVSGRTVESDKIRIFDSQGSDQPTTGVKDINIYDISSSELLSRLEELLDENSTVGVTFNEVREGSTYGMYDLHVDWLRAEKGDANYKHSIDYLMSMLKTPMTRNTETSDLSMVLYGDIGKGTVNEQSLMITFELAFRAIKNLKFNRWEPAVRENGAVAIDEAMAGTVTVDFATWESKKLTVRLNKPFALTIPVQGGRVYASAYEYLAYLFEQVTVEFTNGIISVIRPEIEKTTFVEETVNETLLKNGFSMELRLNKLSEGSAIDVITVEVISVKDELKNSYDYVTADPYKAVDLETGELGGERYSDGYNLDGYFDVEYEISGVVRYTVKDGKWNVGANSKRFFAENTVSKIDASLINVLGDFNGVPKDYPQAIEYYFEYPIPWIDVTFIRTIRIPRKNIREVYYDAYADDGQYDIKNGVINVFNPYSYFREGLPDGYGIDITKLPNEILAQKTDYYDTDRQVRSHYVSWTINDIFKVADFEARFETGIEVEFDEDGYPLAQAASSINAKNWFAYCDLDSYYVTQGNEVTRTRQRVYLYVNMPKVQYEGIEYGVQNIETKNGKKNLIVVDPYDDPMNYNHIFKFPTDGLRVYFSETYQDFADVKFNLFKTNGELKTSDIKEIYYDEHGADSMYDECINADGTMYIEAYIPGFRPINGLNDGSRIGLPIYLKILPKIIAEVEIENDAYDADGRLVGGTRLPVYYIDPYNDATFALPYKAWIRFQNDPEGEFGEHMINGWSLVTDDGAIPLNDAKDFYSRTSERYDNVSYGFYKSSGGSYAGAIYTLQGHITIGKTMTGGEVGKQTFNVYVIVLNRSLQEKYYVSHRFTDPLGGLLQDIPSEISEDFFVDYDSDYASLAVENGFMKYSDFSTPTVPAINWEVYNSQSVIDPLGGFDKEIEGNVYTWSNAKSALKSKAQTDIDAKFETLTRARIFDACFTDSGNPQAYFVNAEPFVQVAKTVETQTAYATYKLTVTYLSSDSDEEMKQLGSYLANGLLNEIMAEYGSATDAERTEILFNRLKENYKNSQNSRDRIYAAWLTVYNNYKAAGSDYNANVSAYQQLKADVYDTLIKDLHTKDLARITDRIRPSIETSLLPYKNAAYWDEIYERSSDAERAQMESILNGTTETAKSNAYTVYMQRQTVMRGNIGETVGARITAPTMKVVEVYQNSGLAGSGSRIEITEFLFNQYTTIAFLNDVDVETVISYKEILDEYIAAALEKALDNYRAQNLEASLKEYVYRKTAEYVNQAIPTQKNDAGISSPIFEYTYGKEESVNGEFAGYWKKLYSNATAETSSRLSNLKKAYGNVYNKAIFDEIIAYHQVLDDTITSDGKTIKVTEYVEEKIIKTYGYNKTAFDAYEALMLKRDTELLDAIRAEVQKSVDASLAALLAGSSLDVGFNPTLSAFGTRGTIFSTMFGAEADDMYDLLLASFGGTGTNFGQAIETVYRNTTGGKGAAFFAILRENNNISTEITGRATNIYNWKLGGAKAFDALEADPSVIGLTNQELTALVDITKGVNEIGYEASYNDAFDSTDFASFRKSVVFDRLRSGLSGNYKTALDNLYNEAVQGTLAKAYQTLYQKGDTAVRNNLDTMRQNREDFDRKSFVAFVAYYEQEGEKIQSGVDNTKTYQAARDVFYASKTIWNELNTDSAFTPYRQFLSATDEAAAKQAGIKKYRDTFATDAEKAAINYCLAIYGDGAYDKLSERKEYGASFVEGIENSYYFVCLAEMTAKVRTAVEASNPFDGVSESDFTDYGNEIETYLYAVRGSYTTSANQNVYNKKRELAYVRFIEKLTEGALKPYYDRVNAVESDGLAKGLTLAYDRIYAYDADELNEVLLAIYKEWREDNPDQAKLGANEYAAFNELLTNDELQNYYYAINEIADEKGCEAVYDGLATFGLKNDVDTVARAAFENVATVYNGLPSGVKSKLNTQISAGYFVKGERETYSDKVCGFVSAYATLGSTEWSDQEVLTAANNLMTAIYETACSVVKTDETTLNMSDGDKLLITAIEFVEGEKAYRQTNKRDEKAVTVKTAAGVLTVISAVSDGASEAYIGLPVTTAGKKAEFVKILSEVLADCGYKNAADYILAAAAENGEKYLAFNPNKDSSDYDEELEQEIIARLKVTSEYGNLVNGNGELKYTGLSDYISDVRQKTSAFINGLREGYTLPVDPTDEDYENLFAAIVGDKTEYVTFYTEDSVDGLGADANRRIVIFDKRAFENDPQITQGQYYVYFGNAAKLDLSDVSQLKNDERVKSKLVTYKYLGAGQIDTLYVDFYGDTTIDFAKLNAQDTDPNSENYGKKGNGIDKILVTYNKLNAFEIDPLAPVLPSRVRVYGVYTFTETIKLAGGATKILNDQKQVLDLGMMAVAEYGELFYDSVYDGQSGEKSYSIVLEGNGRTRTVSNISVSYPDRRIDKVYLDDDWYGGVIDGTNSNLYNLYDRDRGVNVIKIDPVRQEFLDVYEHNYLMPEKITVRYRAEYDYMAEEAEYEDIEWDMDGVAYSLDGLSAKPIRPKKYRIRQIENGVETIRLIEFVDDTVLITVIDIDGNKLGDTLIFNGVPDKTVWNLELDIISRTPRELVDNNGKVLGVYSEKDKYIDVTPSAYSLNPYDIIYPSTVRLNLNNNSQTSALAADWQIAAGVTGEGKLQSIMNGTAIDKHLVATFDYLGYQISVRFATDDISLGVAQKDYVNGGIIYLVADRTLAAEQLSNSYPYFYYNFDVTTDAYLKVPLGFSDSNVRGIDTSKAGIYYDVKGCLGWDKEKYPNMTLVDNISFTIQVIDPVAYAKLDGDTNRFVIYDYVSAPYDGNFHKRTDPNEPDGFDEFVHFGLNGEGLNFAIDKDSITYDVLGGTVYFRCKFDLNGGGTVFNPSSYNRLAGSETGSQIVTFRVAVPFKGYLYTGVSEVYFDKVPVKDGLGNDIWKWTKVDEHDAAYCDAIVWTLGRTMKASDLPQAYTERGEKISLTWDLTGVNVNKATGLSEGYKAIAYYYDADGIWQSATLTVYIEKQNIYQQVLNAVGGSLVIEKTYDGNHYRSPFDPNADEMKVLREDGSYGALMETSVDYKPVNKPDWEYSQTDYPLNAGDYNVRIRIMEDYNATMGGELVLTLRVNPDVVHAVLLRFDSEQGSGKIAYVYNGEARELTAISGMPTVKVENWFETSADKAALVNAQRGEGVKENAAKTAAYNVLYEAVTQPTKDYMDRLIRQAEAEHGWKNDELYASVWDSLAPALEICEVVQRATYMGDVMLAEAPTDVGVYTAWFDVRPEDNKGNYVFDTDRLSFTLTITQPEVTYSPMETELVYNGRAQNPKINGLHDADGRLPAGVTITYTYKYYVGNAENILVNGITNVGTYTCSVKISGGVNYPNGELSEFTVKVLPKDLYIDIPVKLLAESLAELAEIMTLLRQELVGKVDPTVIRPEIITGIGNGTTNAETVAELFNTYMTGDALKDTLDYIAEKVSSEYIRLLAGELGGGEGAYLDDLADLIDRRGGNGVLTEIAVYILRNGGEEYLGILAENVVNVVGSEYLQEIEDVTRFIKYHGLVGNDLPSDFGVMDIVMNVQDYYTIGVYGIDFNGFKVNGDSLYAYTYNVSGSDGYSRVELKSYGQDGSILGLSDPISTRRRNMFTNYNVYVSERNDYRIRAEIGAILVYNSEELQQALNSISNGSNAIIYLMPKTDEDGNTDLTAPNVYDAITINVNAGITIIGCYDDNRNILTEIKGITVLRGAVNLKILSFKAQKTGDVSLTIGEKANDVTVYDCIFDGNGYDDAVAIKTDRLYASRLYVGGSTFGNSRSGIELDGGKLGLGNGTDGGNVFENNDYGIRITSDSDDVRIENASFIGQAVGVYCENAEAVILNNFFDYNRTAIRLVKGDANEAAKQNVFGEYNGVTIDDSKL